MVGAALLCAGCELPHGPLRWDPVQIDLLKHNPFHEDDNCCDEGSPACAHEPQGYEPDSQGTGEAPYSPRGPRLPQHHQAVPLAGPGINAPWPKFHPVPTRPVFEPRCLPAQLLPLE